MYNVYIYIYKYINRYSDRCKCCECNSSEFCLYEHLKLRCKMFCYGYTRTYSIHK